MKEDKWLRYTRVEETIQDAIRDTPCKDGTSDFVWDEIYTALDHLKRQAKLNHTGQVKLSDVERCIYQGIDDTPKKRAPKGAKDPIWARIYLALEELRGEHVGQKTKASRVGAVLAEKPLWIYRMVAHEAPYFIELKQGDKSLGSLTFRRFGDQLRPDKNLLSAKDLTPDGLPVNQDADVIDPMVTFADEVFSLIVRGGEFEIDKEEVYPERGPLLDLSEMLRSGNPDNAEQRTLTPKQARARGNTYQGIRARWSGVPGNVMKIDADLIMPTTHNKFSADQLASYYRSIKAGKLLPTPIARVEIVEPIDVEASRIEYKDGNLSRPLREKDIGKPFAVLTDGNHRAFAAILAGEPYVYVYVLPVGREKVRDRLEGVGGKEWHESKEYFGGGEEATRAAANRALAEEKTRRAADLALSSEDHETLKRIMQSVNAAPDVILSILKHDPEQYSWLLKQQPRLYELVQEEPLILHAMTNGMFEALLRFAIGSGQVQSFLGKPTKVLRFSKILSVLRRGNADSRELAKAWPSFMEKFACGALRYESGFSDGEQIWQNWDDALWHIMMEVEGQRFFFENITPFRDALRDKRNKSEPIDAEFLWKQFSRFADKPTQTVGASRRSVKGLPSLVAKVGSFAKKTR